MFEIAFKFNEQKLMHDVIQHINKSFYAVTYIKITVLCNTKLCNIIFLLLLVFLLEKYISDVKLIL